MLFGRCADAQRSGAGAVVRGLERTLRNHGGRLLIVDTSGRAYSNARAFYQSLAIPTSQRSRIIGPRVTTR